MHLTRYQHETIRSRQLPMQSMPITTKVLSSNPVHGEVYSIQHYVIKFVSDLQQISGFSTGNLVLSINKTDCHNITEILLKVALNTITLTIALNCLTAKSCRKLCKKMFSNVSQCRVENGNNII